MHWQAVLAFWLVLQLPAGILMGKALKKQSSFADGPHPVSETAGSGSSPPAPALNLLCHSKERA